LTWLRTYPDSDPTLTSTTLHMDAASGPAAAFAILAALHYRQRTGKGQFIDFGQAENLMQQIGEILMDYTLNGRSQTSLGNRHPLMAPHGCFPCKGNDRWVVIAIATDAEWERFCQAIGKPDLADDRRFAKNVNRVENRAALIALLTEVFLGRDNEAWLTILNEAEVPCAPVQTIDQVFAAPQVRHREMLVEVEHPNAGNVKMAGIPVKFSLTPASVRLPPPLLGQHTEEVLAAWLGMGSDEIDVLKRKRVI